MVLAEIKKNEKERIRISVETYRGSQFVDCRVYWEDQEGEWRPSRKGIALSPDTIDLVIEALQKAREKLEG